MWCDLMWCHAGDDAELAASFAGLGMGGAPSGGAADVSTSGGDAIAAGGFDDNGALTRGIVLVYQFASPLRCDNTTRTTVVCVLAADVPSSAYPIS